MSGQMVRPRCSKSSPVLATTSSSSAGSTRRQAERQLGAADAAGQRDDTTAHRNRSSAGGPHQLDAASVGGHVPAQAAHQHDGLRLRRLALHQRCRGGDLVGEAGDADLQRAAEQVGLAAQVQQRRHAGRADRHAAGAAPPGAAEAVVDHHAERQAGAPAPRASRAALASGSSGSSSTRSTPSSRPDIGLVDAGIGHDQAEPVLDDEQVRAGRAPRAPIRDSIISTRRGSLPASAGQRARPRPRA